MPSCDPELFFSPNLRLHPAFPRLAIASANVVAGCLCCVKAQTPPKTTGVNRRWTKLESQESLISVRGQNNFAKLVL